MIKCKILDSGNLLVIANNETRKHIKKRYIEKEFKDSIYSDLFEGYETNGSYTPFNASYGRPFVGLTEAPCVAESMNYDDEGEPIIEGRLWWFPDYMIRDPLQELKNKGRVVFALAK